MIGQNKAIRIEFNPKLCSIDIESYAYGFTYLLMKDMYTTGDGWGIQVNNPEDEQDLKEMCGKIARAVLEYENVTLKRDLPDGKPESKVDSRKGR